MSHIYLAGKISKGDWRSDLFGTNRPMSIDASDMDAEWGEAPIPGTIHTAVGPWFVSCDHGCAHGPNSHGVGADDAIGCVAATLYDDNFKPHEQPDRRPTVAARCLFAIRSCDVFFAWLEPTAYGTLVEIGFAKACGARIVIGRPMLDNIKNDLWFAEQMANEIVYADSPLEAVRKALAGMSDLSRMKCESPIEEAMCDALRRAGTAPFAAFNQHQEGAYRLDFALIHPDGIRKINVEVDGHDFHEKTKEQARSDKARDRALTLCGWRILRFTGSEVHRDVGACVAQVKALIAGMVG